MYLNTFSIVAFDPATKTWGVAVASKFLAVGAYVPFASADAGAVATQAYVNLTYGPRGLDLMRRGMTATDVVHALVSNDPGRDERQLGVVDLHGRSATFTGSKCMDWAGGIAGDGFAAQGNILAGPRVIEVMAAAFSQTTGLLQNRLMAALKAADDAGGDRRGKQSAALVLVRAGAGYGGFNDRVLDLRADDHANPVAELARLMTLHDLYFGKSPEHERIAIDQTLLRELQAAMARSGHYRGPLHGDYDAATRDAWRAFTGTENLEERVDLERRTIDPPALEYIRKRFS